MNSSATAEAVAHKNADTKRMASIGLAHHGLGSVPKVRMPTEIYHNSMLCLSSGYRTSAQRVSGATPPVSSARTGAQSAENGMLIGKKDRGGAFQA